MIRTIISESRSAGRKGIAALHWPKTGRWHLVPSISNQFGGRDYDWSKVLPESYPTKKAAIEARKSLRARSER